ncbi:hypothetical protein LP420_06620 [Massilia sp. B-10]|nr:hypothetical protein LP420_06620 [Massilia sp. B-10]
MVDTVLPGKRPAHGQAQLRGRCRHRLRVRRCGRGGARRIDRRPDGGRHAAAAGRVGPGRRRARRHRRRHGHARPHAAAPGWRAGHDHPHPHPGGRLAWREVANWQELHARTREKR